MSHGHFNPFYEKSPLPLTIRSPNSDNIGGTKRPGTKSQRTKLNIKNTTLFFKIKFLLESLGPPPPPFSPERFIPTLRQQNIPKKTDKNCLSAHFSSSCVHRERKRESFKGTVSRKISPMLLYINR